MFPYCKLIRNFVIYAKVIWSFHGISFITSKYIAKKAFTSQYNEIDIFAFVRYTISTTGTVYIQNCKYLEFDWNTSGIVKFPINLDEISIAKDGRGQKMCIVSQSKQCSSGDNYNRAQYALFCNDIISIITLQTFSGYYCARMQFYISIHAECLLAIYSKSNSNQAKCFSIHWDAEERWKVWSEES